MTDPIPAEEIYSALRDRDEPGGQAADWFAFGFEQAEHGAGTRAGNVVAYCGREALMSLLALGGVRPGGFGEAVDQVLAAAEGLEPGDAEKLATLSEKLEALRVKRKERGSHRTRLAALILEMTGRQSIEFKQDLFDRYLATLDALNGHVHSGAAASLESARELLQDAFQIVGRLFAPISMRFDVIDSLVAVVDPTAADVDQLVGWNGDPRILSYFFTRVKTPGWLQALSGHELLMPPVDRGVWPALPYLRELGKFEPALVKKWMGRQPRGDSLSTQQAFHYLQLARSIHAPVDSELLQILKGHFTAPAIVQLLLGYFDTRPTAGQDVGATFGLIKHALDGASGDEALTGGSYILGALLRQAISLARTSDVERWLGVLCAKTRNLFGDSVIRHDWAINRVQAIPTLHVEDSTHLLEQFVAAIRDLLQIAEHAGVTTEARHAKLRKLPSPLAGRLIASELLAAAELDISTALEHVAAQIASLEPTPENLSLIRRLREVRADDLSPTVSTALGVAPTLVQVGGLGEDERIPRRWADVYGWSVALPEDSLGDWRAAVELCRSRWGEPNPNGVVMPPAVATWIPDVSPYPETELAELPPLEAARVVAAWAPDPAEDYGPNRLGLATALQKRVEAGDREWFGPDAAKIVRTLSRPVYLLPYFAAANSVDADSLEVSILDAIEEATELYQSDLGKPLDFEGPSWSSVLRSALGLLRRIDLGEPGRQERVWALLQPLIDPEEKVEPMTQTICGAVIFAAIDVADATSRTDQPPDGFIELLERFLAVDGPAGESARDAIGPNLPWLLAKFPTWANEHWADLVGDRAPSRLGEHTFSAYLARGKPTRRLLLRCPSELWAAMDTVPAAAQGHIMHGLLWNIDGYEPDTVVAKLASASDTAVSAAAAWLGMAAARSPDLDLGPAIQFWGSALRADLPVTQYEGFGHFAVVERLDRESWLDLALPTARISSPGLALSGENARRASESGDDPRALRLVAALLHSKLEPWEIFDIGRTGVELFRDTRTADRSAISELRERLLEREFYEVRGSDGPGVDRVDDDDANEPSEAPDDAV